MRNKKEQNLLRIQALAMENAKYRELLWEYEERNGRVLAAMEGMSEGQRSAVEDYLGLMAEMGNYLLIIACENMEFSGGK